MNRMNKIISEVGIARVSLIPSILFILSTTLCMPANATDTWRAGVAEVVITPDNLMWMSGYGARDHRAEGKLHELHCKALVIEQTGGEPLVLITLDLVGIDRDTSSEVCRRLE